MSFLSPEFSLPGKAAQRWEDGDRDVDGIG